MAELAAKRARTDSWCGLPEAGEESSEWLEKHGMILRHGSSLALMSLVSTALNESDEFGDIEPEEDWKKWSARRPGFQLYYAALVDPARDGAEGVACVLRAVLDPAPAGAAPARRSRLIVDYVTTRPAARGRGLASAAGNFVTAAASCNEANTYVLALEDSCVYWMSQGFVLEASERLACRLNIFSDTHLLRRSSDVLDDGEPGDEDLEGDEDDEEEEEDDDEDEELQRVLALSAAAPAPAVSASDLSRALAAAMGGPPPADDDDDAALKAALARSLADS